MARGVNVAWRTDGTGTGGSGQDGLVWHICWLAGLAIHQALPGISPYQHGTLLYCLYTYLRPSTTTLLHHAFLPPLHLPPVHYLPLFCTMATCHLFMLLCCMPPVPATFPCPLSPTGCPPSHYTLLPAFSATSCAASLYYLPTSSSLTHAYITTHLCPSLPL